MDSILALSVFAPQIHLSHREKLWHNGTVSGHTRGSLPEGAGKTVRF